MICVAVASSAISPVHVVVRKATISTIPYNIFFKRKIIIVVSRVNVNDPKDLINYRSVNHSSSCPYMRLAGVLVFAPCSDGSTMIPWPSVPLCGGHMIPAAVS